MLADHGGNGFGCASAERVTGQPGKQFIGLAKDFGLVGLHLQFAVGVVDIDKLHIGQVQQGRGRVQQFVVVGDLQAFNDELVAAQQTGHRQRLFLRPRQHVIGLGLLAQKLIRFQVLVAQAFNGDPTDQRHRPDQEQQPVENRQRAAKGALGSGFHRFSLAAD